MISFIVALLALMVGYALYGSVVEKAFGADPSRTTPAYKLTDGVDFVPLSWPRIFLIQFLNIAGLGPIFGAILGALYGPSAFIWIVFGCIFAGAVHDYFSGMMSLRHDGKSIPEVVGIYLGLRVRQFMRILSIVLLLLVGVVFMVGPASLLSNLGFEGIFANKSFWLAVIIGYYFIATILPVDKVIAKIYPLFAVALLFMAVGIAVMLVVNDLPVPEVGTPSNHPAGLPVWPMLCITIACGAISGFHATQSPLMARCVPNETFGRRVFYGAMVAEGVVTLIWAAAAMAFFPNGIGGLSEVLDQGGPSLVVNEVAIGLMGSLGGMLAILGVIACPITSGDTAFRSLRLIFADMLNIGQVHMFHRLVLAVPVFLIGYLLTLVDFSIIWRYFAFSNQALATIVLWTAAVYMAVQDKNVWIPLVPAVFMTAVCTTYILMAPEGLALSSSIAWPAGALVALASGLVFIVKVSGKRQQSEEMV
ncbi:carbon starvation protein CstA [Endozoicomonas montiporae]|uniref:Carbon starvation protein CstA n=2 Tax=Endozoicomonas montiporae TaxID=1027273 RepID=A0A081N3G9_9GAMM|nr:carbon starvation protein A [Endozoicomonas montiporae]AMO58299.1 carbon starvation protein A [Endozoicomonas montiporae CL-33]KEQ12992.1 carbon starvation protein CstA [Endozoicomonas montiporae]